MANAWSYSAGEKGRNRVRAFEHPSYPGLFFLEYYEAGKKKRKSLGRVGVGEAKVAADRVAAELGAAGTPAASSPAGPLTLGTLFDEYLREVTPDKGASKQGHDRRCAEMFGRYWGRGTEVRTLSRREWDQFIRDRRSGKIAPAGTAKRRKLKEGEKALPPRPVRNRVIAYDLQWLQAVLNWATVASDRSGEPLLARNPLRGLERPTEANPRRPALSSQEYAALLSVADQVGPQFRLALVLARETGHRISAIRLLRWSDVDLDGALVTWRAENDKIGLEHKTPLTPEAVAALRAEQARQGAIGDRPVFPAAEAPDEPISRHLTRDWWERAEKLAGLEPNDRRGWHSLRRQFATDLKEVPLKDLCVLGGWKDPQTILKCYMQADEETMRNALEKRRVAR